MNSILILFRCGSSVLFEEKSFENEKWTAYGIFHEIIKKMAAGEKYYGCGRVFLCLEDISAIHLEKS